MSEIIDRLNKLIAYYEEVTGTEAGYKAIDDTKPGWRQTQLNKVGVPRNRFAMTDQKALAQVRWLRNVMHNTFLFKKTSLSGGLSVTGILDARLARFWEYCSTDSQGNIKAYQLFVLTEGKLYCFAFGNTGIKVKKESQAEITGKECADEFVRTAKKTGIDMDKYASSKEEAKQIKASIPKQLISTVSSQSDYYRLSSTLQKTLDDNRLVKVHNVCHIDFHESYMSHLIEAYPEFQAVADAFNAKYPHKIAKTRLSASIGYFQSTNGHVLKTGTDENYYALKYDRLTKAAMEGNLRDIKKLAQVLTASGMPVIGYNTDGIWFIAKDSSTAAIRKVFKKADLKVKASLDYKDATLVLSGANWIMTEGYKLDKTTLKYYKTFDKALRGNYTYTQKKPYDKWNTWEDCLAALQTHIKITCWLDDRRGFFTEVKEEYEDLSAYKDWTKITDITDAIAFDAIIQQYNGDNF